MTRWKIIGNKADPRPRLVVDGLSPLSNGLPHYSRQTPGASQWTRPGYNLVLYLEQRNGRAAAFCWWRPKWESGIPGTERKDRLRCIECTLFRNESRFRSSDLIREATEIVLSWERARDVEWPDGLITGVNSVRTAAGRTVDSPAGKCFIEAGWRPFEKGGTSRADVWLRADLSLAIPQGRVA